jgi:hypothetical protein
MKASRVTTAMALVGLLTLAGLVATRPAQSDQPTVADQVKAIDTDCLAIQNAVMALKPIQLVSSSANWKIASDADVTIAEQTKGSVIIANIWKQGDNYAWVHSHRWDQNGNERATQLCFRQADGTLERARQAGTVPALNEASATAAYFAPDGTVLLQAKAFEANDPMLAKSIKALPFYKQLP